MTFGEKIQTLRKEKNWSQSDFAEKLSSHSTLIGKYERGETKPSINVAKKMAKLLEVSIDYLVDDDNNSTVIKDRTMIERIKKLDQLQPDEKNYITMALDAMLRDATTKQAYLK
jgi:transcriptional regulator with XRE-family HTH domain